MNHQERTLIFYHVPEDKDKDNEPNVFTIPLSQNKLKIAHIHQHFPLKGNYVFRFKIAYDAFVVWLDAVSMDMPVPTFKN